MLLNQGDTGGAPVFDRKDLLRRLGDDVPLAKDIIKVFLSDAPAQLERLRQAIDRRDAAEIEAAGHRLRGAAANLGGLRLKAAVEVVERSGREPLAADLWPPYHKAVEEYRLLEEAMLEEWAGGAEEKT
jgi:HPt (histidine-containing phosphotransfer) domain-containing protein